MNKHMRLLLALCFAIAVGGCTTDTASRSNSTRDNYVPWWVEDGVPNADGVIITR